MVDVRALFGGAVRLFVLLLHHTPCKCVNDDKVVKRGERNNIWLRKRKKERKKERSRTAVVVGGVEQTPLKNVLSSADWVYIPLDSWLMLLRWCHTLSSPVSDPHQMCEDQLHW